MPRRRARLQEARETRRPEREALALGLEDEQRSRLEIITWSEDTVETRTRAPRGSWAREEALVTFPQSLVVWLPRRERGLRRASGRRKWLRES